MKVKVIEEFRDRHPGNCEELGIFWTSQPRGKKEILSVGRLVERVTGSAAGRKAKQKGSNEE